MSYFRYCHGLRMTSPAFDRLFDGPPRQAEATITQREMDIAASIQAVTEEVMLRCATHVHRETGMRNLVLAGGVALNCVGNGRIVREGRFEKVWIQPASGDAGGALGVALFIWHQLLDHPRIPDPIDSQHGSLLGPVFSDDVVGDALDALDAVYRRFDDDDSLCEAVAGQESPYMLLVAPVRDEERLPADGDGGGTGFDRLKLARSTIPAVTHVDYSARVQTVDEARHGRYHRLLQAFARKTGCPAVINQLQRAR